MSSFLRALTAAAALLIALHLYLPGLRRGIWPQRVPVAEAPATADPGAVTDVQAAGPFVENPDPARPHMPAVVYVNNRPWHLFYVPSINGTLSATLGSTHCGRLTIFVHQGMTLEYERYVVFHELTHAGSCVFSGRDAGWPDDFFYNSEDKLEHNGIWRIAEMWADVLSHNPALAAYLSTPFGSDTNFVKLTSERESQ